MKRVCVWGKWIVASFLILFFVSCLNDESQQGRKVTGYEKYTVVVASQKVPGVVFSCGFGLLADVYPVKTNEKGDWDSFGDWIDGFDYEPGYEYKIKISKTSYLDYRMGSPAWSEYALVELISKIQKQSEGVPVDFIPEWWTDPEDRESGEMNE